MSDITTVEFVLNSNDHRSPALIRLLAFMWEKEGEPAEVVADAISTAERMEEQARERGKIPLTLDGLLSLAASLKPEAVKAPEPISPQAFSEPLQEGDIVIAGRGGPSKLIKIFGPEAPDQVRGKANIMMPRATVPTTVDLAVLRRALPEEVAKYRDDGGK